MISRAIATRCGCRYYFTAELQDILTMGCYHYALMSSGVGNIIDWVVIFMGLISVGYFYESLAWRKADDGDHFYSQMAVAQEFQLCAGFFLFFILVKGMKFARNIPTMRTCGDTIAACKLELILFTFMLVILLLAFAFIFNCTFSTRVVFHHVWCKHLTLN